MTESTKAALILWIELLLRIFAWCEMVIVIRKVSEVYSLCERCCQIYVYSSFYLACLGDVFRKCTFDTEDNDEQK